MDLAWIVLDRCFWAICGLFEIFKPFVSCNIKWESIIYGITFSETQNNHNKIKPLCDGKILFGQVCSERLDAAAFNPFHYCWGFESFKTASFTSSASVMADYKKQNPIKPKTCEPIQVSSAEEENKDPIAVSQQWHIVHSWIELHYKGQIQLSSQQFIFHVTLQHSVNSLETHVCAPMNGCENVLLGMW